MSTGLPRKESAPLPLVLIVEDDEGVREALSSLFRSVGLGVKLFTSAQEALDYSIPDSPVCFVADVRLRGMSGLELQAKLGESPRHPPVIIMTGHGDIPMSVHALKAGAIDFLSKPFRDQEMLDAVAGALSLDRQHLAEKEAAADLQKAYDSLTARERDVLRLVTDGLMNKQIAAELGISEITVKIHRGHVMRKMKAVTLPDLVRMAEALKRRSA